MLSEKLGVYVGFDEVVAEADVVFNGNNVVGNTEEVLVVAGVLVMSEVVIKVAVFGVVDVVVVVVVVDAVIGVMVVEVVEVVRVFVAVVVVVVVVDVAVVGGIIVDVNNFVDGGEEVLVKWCIGSEDIFTKMHCR